MNYNDPPIDPTDPQGTDLILDANGDLVLTTQGDIETITETENVKQMIRVRLQTMPDSYIFGTDLGSELGSTIDEPLHALTESKIQDYVYNALTDPRILQINSVKAFDPNDGSMQYQVTVNVTAINVGEIETTVQIGG